jgi:hypothetical protein
MLEVTPPYSRNTVAKWIGDDTLQDLLSDPSVEIFDGKVRDLLNNADLPLTPTDPAVGDIDFTNLEKPLSELFKALDPESRENVMNKINDLADCGDLDEPLSQLDDLMHHRINNSPGGGLIPMLEVTPPMSQV